MKCKACTSLSGPEYCLAPEDLKEDCKQNHPKYKLGIDGQPIFGKKLKIIEYDNGSFNNTGKYFTTNCCHAEMCILCGQNIGPDVRFCAGSGPHHHLEAYIEQKEKVEKVLKFLDEKIEEYREKTK